MKVVVGASSFADASDKAINLLLDRNIEVVKNPFARKMTTPEMIEHLKDADGLLAGLETINDELLNTCDNLKAIARIGIGMDSVDIESVKNHNIKLSNTPDAPTSAVAEMALTVLLTILHQIIPSNNDVHNGIWKKRIGLSINNLNVLFIGYGRIGGKFGELLKLMGCDISIYDPYRKDRNADKVIDNLEEEIKNYDVVTLHSSSTETILTRELFSKMKDEVIILNCARGNLIDEDALYDNLTNGKVANFWGDVFLEEPYTGKLTKCDNAILTPHLSTYNKTCRETMELEAVKNLLEDLGYEI